MKVSTLIATYRAGLRPRLRWSASKDYWLDVASADLGAERVETLCAERLVRYALETERSELTVRCTLHTLAAVLRAGNDLWRVRADAGAPSAAIRALTLQGMLAPARRREERVSDAELDAIADRWRSRAPAEILHVLVDTAMRSGELARLQWSDLDPRARTIIIRDRKNPTRRGDHQVIPLLGRAFAVVDAQPRRGPRVFPWSQDLLSSAFRAAAHRAELRRLRLHDLRHEGISRLFERGWSIPQVAAVSGHRKWETLRRYTHITPAALHALHEREPLLP